MTTATVAAVASPAALLAPEPTVTALHEESSGDGTGDVGITDQDMFRALVFGFTVGTVGMLAVTFLICLAAGLDAGMAAGVALLPGIFGGLYGGGAPYLTMQMMRAEKRERHADR